MNTTNALNTSADIMSNMDIASINTSSNDTSANNPAYNAYNLDDVEITNFIKTVMSLRSKFDITSEHICYEKLQSYIHNTYTNIFKNIIHDINIGIFANFNELLKLLRILDTVDNITYNNAKEIINNIEASLSNLYNDDYINVEISTDIPFHLYDIDTIMDCIYILEHSSYDVDKVFVKINSCIDSLNLNTNNDDIEHDNTYIHIEFVDYSDYCINNNISYSDDTIYKYIANVFRLSIPVISIRMSFNVSSNYKYLPKFKEKYDDTINHLLHKLKKKIKFIR